jgi:hypothetical protein
MGASQPIEDSGAAEIGERLESIERQIEQLLAAGTTHDETTATRHPKPGLLHHSDRGSSIRGACLSSSARRPRNALFHEAGSKLLRQRAYRELLLQQKPNVQTAYERRSLPVAATCIAGVLSLRPELDIDDAPGLTRVFDSHDSCVTGCLHIKCQVMNAGSNLNGEFKSTPRRNANPDGPDFSPNPPWVTHGLIDNERLQGEIWERACGDGAMSAALGDITNPIVSVAQLRPAVAPGIPGACEPRQYHLPSCAAGALGVFSERIPFYVHRPAAAPRRTRGLCGTRITRDRLSSRGSSRAKRVDFA